VRVRRPLREAPGSLGVLHRQHMHGRPEFADIPGLDEEFGLSDLVLTLPPPRRS
jgi:hypothetical protein